MAPSSSLLLLLVVVSIIPPPLGGAEEEVRGSFMWSSVGLLATGGSWGGAVSMVVDLLVFYDLSVYMYVRWRIAVVFSG